MQPLATPFPSSFPVQSQHLPLNKERREKKESEINSGGRERETEREGGREQQRKREKEKARERGERKKESEREKKRDREKERGIKRSAIA